MEPKAYPGIRIEGESNYSPGTRVHYEGMDLRDYFAGQALIGLLYQETHGAYSGDVVDIAYNLSDRMMERRKTK